MNVLFICQCERRALTESRRILDQFAERRGERTWQTAITQVGLDTVRKLLRHTARKNTAVACHWIRGVDHSELLWIVGDAKQFNSQGTVPTNTTLRNILRQEDENDWRSGQDIHLLTVLSALLHDLGKACVAFQKRLNGQLSERNQYRHEWISLRLFEAFVGDDDDAVWLARLQNPSPEDDATWLGRLQRDGIDQNCTPPFARLSRAPLAQAIGWLVVTHHRLPQEPCSTAHSAGISSESDLRDVLNKVTAYWNEDARTRFCDEDSAAKPLDVGNYWDIPLNHLPVATPLWRKRAARVAQGLQKLLAQNPESKWLENPYVMHLSRLCLMWADHHYSSLTVDGKGVPQIGRVSGQKNFPAFANTYQKEGKTIKNQPLDEHLLGVAQYGADISHSLPQIVCELPRLARHKGLKKPTTDERFRWQNKAADLAVSVRERAQQNGAFIVNLASTGCGKTLANARIMYALADPQRGMRCAFAMGLRTLTLQTGQAFQDLLGLKNDDLAIRAGGMAHRALFDHYQQLAEANGSASRQALLDEDSYVQFEGDTAAHPLLKRLLKDPQTLGLISAPVLVSTIDHLMPATESTRGGHQMLPMLRLLTSDLVLDEPDDFDMTDLPALTRLVYWAGLLGARVLLSSATLPPDFVQGLFEAYRHGRAQYQCNRGTPTSLPSAICCLWVDESGSPQHADCVEGSGFAEQHQIFVKARVTRLKERTPPGLAQLALLELKKIKAADLPTSFAQRILDLAPTLHQNHHSADPQSGKRVSFGLVRMANIAPLVAVALALYRKKWPADTRIHLCAYHSQYPLLLRSRIEQRLDKALNRKARDAVFDLPDIRARLDAYPEQNHIFIVLGSPVTEVGRDHDYDWAIVEPSSMRSLIQLAGRVRRHRGLNAGEKLSAPNIRVFETNLKFFKNGDEKQAAFLRPGFEHAGLTLTTHNLKQLLGSLLNPQNAQFTINATPRLRAPDSLNPNNFLVDLEHQRMRDQMLSLEDKGGLNAASCWQLAPKDAMLTATLQRQQGFRHDTDPRPDVDLRLMPDEDAPRGYTLQRTAAAKNKTAAQIWATVGTSQLQQIPDGDVRGDQICPWGDTDYLEALGDLADQMDIELHQCAAKFGTLSLKDDPNGFGWRFHPALGFSQGKS